MVARPGSLKVKSWLACWEKSSPSIQEPVLAGEKISFLWSRRSVKVLLRSSMPRFGFQSSTAMSGTESRATSDTK